MQIVATLPPDDLASQVGALVEGHAAEWDYHLKAHAKRVNSFFEAITELNRGSEGTAHESPEQDPVRPR